MPTPISRPATARSRFSVDGVVWPYREHAYLLLNKPAGYECSRDPQHHLSVFSLLPPQFAERGVQCVGRLDQDTTGLLLLSDDGKFVHLFTSPKRKVPKVYVATTRHPIDDAQLSALRDGVLLHGEPKPIAAVDAEARGDSHARAHRDGRQVSPGQADDRGGRQPLRSAASRADRRTRFACDACAEAHGNGSTKPTSDLYGAGKPVAPLQSLMQQRKPCALPHIARADALHCSAASQHALPYTSPYTRLNKDYKGFKEGRHGHPRQFPDFVT